MNRRAILSALIFASAPGLARASGKPEKKKGGGVSYIQIPALVASTSPSGGRRSVLTVETGVDIPDAKLRALCELSLPRLRSAYVHVVQIYAAGLGPTSLPNADFLAVTLQRETDRVLGRKGARLLLGSMMIN